MIPKSIQEEGGKRGKERKKKDRNPHILAQGKLMLSGIWKSYCCCPEPTSSMTSLWEPCIREFTHHFLHLLPLPLRRLSHHLNLLWKKMATFHSCHWLPSWNVPHPDVQKAHLLHDVHLFWTQISVYWRDALHAVLSNNSSSKWVRNDTWRCLHKWQKTHLNVWCLVLVCAVKVSAEHLPPRQQRFWGQSHHTPAWLRYLLWHARPWLLPCESSQGDCDCPPPGFSYPPSIGHLVLQPHWSSPKQHR